MILRPTSCPLCLPRADDSPSWLKVRKLGVSTLYLDRNQTYRGHCQLVYDPEHVAGLEALSPEAFGRVMSDLHDAARAIARCCRPDRMNYASMNNVVPHLHWHLVPRYQSDPRWGLPIYRSDPSEMPVKCLSEAEYATLVADLNFALDAAQPVR